MCRAICFQRPLEIHFNGTVNNIVRCQATLCYTLIEQPRLHGLAWPFHAKRYHFRYKRGAYTESDNSAAHCLPTRD